MFWIEKGGFEEPLFFAVMPIITSAHYYPPYSLKSTQRGLRCATGVTDGLCISVFSCIGLFWPFSPLYGYFPAFGRLGAQRASGASRAVSVLCSSGSFLYFDSCVWRSRIPGLFFGI